MTDKEGFDALKQAIENATKKDEHIILKNGALDGMLVLGEKDLNRLIKDVEDCVYDDVYLDERCQAHWDWSDIVRALEYLLRIGKQNTKSILENGEVK